MKRFKNEKFEKDLLMGRKGNANTLTEAQWRVLNEYDYYNKEYDSDLLILESILWEKNYEGALRYMKEAGIEEIIILNTSTELMELLHFFLSNGCEMVGPITFLAKDEWSATKKGLKIKL